MRLAWISQQAASEGKPGKWLLIGQPQVVQEPRIRMELRQPRRPRACAQELMSPNFLSPLRGRVLRNGQTRWRFVGGFWRRRRVPALRALGGDREEPDKARCAVSELHRRRGRGQARGGPRRAEAGAGGFDSGRLTSCLRSCAMPSWWSGAKV